MRPFIVFLLLFFLPGFLVAQKNKMTRQNLLTKLKVDLPDSDRVCILTSIVKSYAEDEHLRNANDSAEQYLKVAISLNDKRRNLKNTNQINILAAMLSLSKNSDQDVTALFYPIIYQCRQTGDYASELAAITVLCGKLPVNSQNLSYHVTNYRRAIYLSVLLEDKAAETSMNYHIADVYQKQNQLDSAIRYLFRITADRGSPHRNMLAAYDMLSGIYTTKGFYNKALHYGFATVNDLKGREDSTNFFLNICGRLRFIYANLEKYTESNTWGLKAYDYAYRNNNREYLPMIRGTIVSNLINAGKPQDALKFVLTHNVKDKSYGINELLLWHRQLGDCYLALKNHKAAEENYLMLVRIMAGKPKELSPWDRTVYHYVLGKFYLSTGRPATAKNYLETALAGFKEHQFKQFIKDNYLLLSKADSATGDYKSALINLHRSNKLKDSLFSEQKNKQIEELQLGFETEQKTKVIQALRDSANLERLTLRHTRLGRDAITVGLAFLIIIAGLLYRHSTAVSSASKKISEKNEELNALVNEKEWLLKEVHHRVKNNLHTVISLLESQAQYLKDDALRAIETSQHRIFAMSLLHQKLYLSDDVKTIDIREYIGDLIINLEESFGTSGKIVFEVDVAPVTLNLTYAIPLGLIINEAVTNSIKHAFSATIRGRIRIILKRSVESIRVEMSDNGSGLPDVSHDTRSRTLGIELMKGLSEDINASIRFEASSGTRILLEFEPTLK
ncbi:hypothetical protein D0C36_24330 [Mucilaginibacter conchicola]|uniref:histidine kinase n=1 Tax=Mucilaginibacter conchicola TaxID=2303333 RepID=A0A372NNQ4_9SPHI|nr:histidine kinase dimerization/phosphoacceptor domain -containing protein [Mucilaginibacter conchicola]RFZ89873.1 hypothetical protein D0C36_24330 [Mucilaginibacter conchicola]